MSDKKMSCADMAEKLHGIAMSILLAGMVISIFYQVVSRYFFNFSLVWAEELARGFFVWMVFLGLSHVEKNDEPIKITVFRDAMPPSVKALITQAAQLLSFIFCVVYTIYGFNMFSFLIRTKQIVPGLRIGIAWFYLALPVGFLLTCAVYVLRYIRQAKHLLQRNSQGKEVG